MTLPDLATLPWISSSRDQAGGLRKMRGQAPSIPNLTAVVSGKGGVGKTNTVANLAIASAGLGARVLVIDGDMGLSNMDVLLGLTPVKNAIDVLDGRCLFEEALVTGPNGIRLLPAGSGRNDLARLEHGGARELLREVREVAPAYEIVFLDAGAGIGASVIDLAVAASRVLLVSTPEPTSLTDAYATCKTLWRARPDLRIENLVNLCEVPGEGRRVHEHLARMCERFLESDLTLRGTLLRDRRLSLAVSVQRAVVSEFPASEISREFVALAHSLVNDARLERSDHRGVQ